MRPPGTLRPPLAETSPNKRSRICGSRDSGTKVKVIARAEQLSEKTVRGILERAPNQVSCISNPRSGRPRKLNPHDERIIFRAIVINPKITASQLVAQNVPHVTKKTVYRFLKKSGIQKWRCRERPFLTEEHAAKRLAWALKYNGKPITWWRRMCWSDECSVERGKGGQIEFCYRHRGIFTPLPRTLLFNIITNSI